VQQQDKAGVAKAGVITSSSDGEMLRLEVAQLRGELQKAAVLLASGGPHISPAELALLVEKLQGDRRWGR
jgi:hypothetical protein